MSPAVILDKLPRMLTRPIPKWILIAGFTLAAMAGLINAVGFLGLQHQALAHMSGPITFLSNELSRGELLLALNTLAVIGAFFGGCVVSAVVIRQRQLQLGRHYGAVLVLEAIALGLAWWLLRADKTSGEILAAFACGLQNAMASTYSGAVIRTTHMTGIVTDLGIALGHQLRGGEIDRRRAGLYSLLLAGFFLGGVAGSIGYLRFGFNILLFPSLLTGTGGILYIFLQRAQPLAPTNT